MVTKATTVTYTYTAEDVKKLLIEQLKLDPAKTTVRFDVQDISDDRMGRSPSYSLTQVHLVVNEKASG